MPLAWTDGSQAPEPLATPPLPQDASYRLKTAFLGKPLTRDSLRHQRLTKKIALGVLASDCISSSAYGSEEMLIFLLPAFGAAGFTMLLPLTAVILVILAIVTLSYRDVVTHYTKTGGSYVVARDNFGPVVAQIAAVALMLDYIVTVAIQTAAGTLALTTPFPALQQWNKEIAIGWVLIMFYGNLRGIREAGRTFALPTYLFVGSMVMVILTGIVREIFGDLPVYPHDPGMIAIGHGEKVLGWLGIYALLKAFANGGASLTGLEAISNGVSVFRRPEGMNARRTLVVMSLILGSLVGGVSWLAHQTHAAPYGNGTPTVIGQVAEAVLGHSLFGHALFLFVQAATMMILWTGANTPFSGFPFLASFVAEDQFLPRQLTRRGHRLAFSNGIIVLTVTALALLLYTGVYVDKLVAFYAIGVFTGFTMAGLGMAKHHYINRTGAWRQKMVINTISGLVSMTVVIIFAIVKFTEGAWLIVVISPIAVLLLIRLNRQYRREAAALAVAGPLGGPARNITRHEVILLVDSVDLAVISSVRYARSLKPTRLRAVHLVIDEEHAEAVQAAWESTPALSDTALHLIDCPDRRLVRAVMELAVQETVDPGTHLTLLLPRRSYARVLGRVLHDHTADEIARATSRLPRVVATVVPFDVAGLLARRAASMAEARREVAATKPAATGPAGPERAAVLAHAGRVGVQVPDGAAGSAAGPAAAAAAAGAEAAAGPEATAGAEAVASAAAGQQAAAEPGAAAGPAAAEATTPAAAASAASAPPGAGPGAKKPAPSGQAKAAGGEEPVSARLGIGSEHAATPIADLHWRERATVIGRVRSVRMAPLSGAPSVEVDLWDETGGVTLVFYGRRSIPGLAAGCKLAAEGMVGERKGRLAIANPVYRLLDGARE